MLWSSDLQQRASILGCTLMIESERFFEAFKPIYQTTRCHILEYYKISLITSNFENHKSYAVCKCPRTKWRQEYLKTLYFELRVDEGNQGIQFQVLNGVTCSLKEGDHWGC